MKTYLIRHASASGQGGEAPLTNEGAEQATALVPVLERLGAGPLFASPMLRAIQTLEPFAEASGQEVTHVEDLREWVLSPTPLDDFKSHIQRAYRDKTYALPGGESHADLLIRWSSALAVIHAAGGTPAFATHSGMTGALFQSVDPTFDFDAWRSLRNPDVFELTLDEDGPTAFKRIEL